MSQLAIYDMDRTVTRTTTYTPFLLHAAKMRAPWRLALAPAVAGSMAAYGLKAIDRSRLKEINHQLMLGYSRTDAELAPLVESFAEQTLRENIQPGALRAIAADRAEGRRLVMATASYALYAGAIAERLGFDDVIATKSLRDDKGRLIARIDGENCYGPAKKRMIAAWLAKQGMAADGAGVRFYSDHHSDGPVFEWAEEAVAVNPNRQLRALAEARHWRIEDWR